MIHSILDSDLYKFTMQQAAMKLYPRAQVRYKFIDRGATYFPEEMVKELREAIDEMQDLSLTFGEKNFLKEKLYFLDPVYIDFLDGYKYNPDEVELEWDSGELKIVFEGYLYRTILWEVPVMALVSEIYFKHTGESICWSDFDERNEHKAEDFDVLGAKVADFGTRRRYSYKSQDRMIQQFKKWTFFIGTSNVHFAEKYDLKPIGTQAHEWFMFHAAKYGFHRANSISLGRWVDVYNGDLGIALPDTFTTDVFLKSFDTLYAKLFDGIRHDSGDPVEFGKKVQQHYIDLGIDPTTKTVVFSDGLNFDKVLEIETHHWDVRRSYGIGTWLSNDFPNIKPLNMVIKMIAADPDDSGEWINTIKISDDKGKHTGNRKTIELAKQVLNVK